MAQVAELSEAGLAQRLARILGSGGVLIMPCDTIYGIVGAAPDTESRIRAIKGRGETKPFIQLLAEADWLSRLSAERPPPELLRLWPGALTLVVPSSSGGTVAVRVPDDELLRAVIRLVGRPLYSTSVNLSGQPSLGSPKEVLRVFGALVDLIVAGGERGEGVPSTIVDLTQRPPRLLRQGALRIPKEILRGDRAD